MDPTLAILTALFLLLLGLSGLFSGSETALFSLDRIQLRRFERSRSRRERLVASVAAHPERLLAGILFGNTLVNVASSSLAVTMAGMWTAHSDRQFNPETLVAVAVLADTLVILLLGEILPKGAAVQWPAAFAGQMIWLLDPLLRLVQPVARLLEAVSRWMLRLMGVAAGGRQGGLSRPELQLLFHDIREGKGITENEGEIAANIFEFFETRAWEVMTPRVDLVGIPVDTPRSELRERVARARHSRLPVYRDSLDQVLGFLNTKEVLLDQDRTLEELLKPVHFVPERARLYGVFSEVQTQRHNMVVVVNEYGGTSGIITTEDLVEEIVGEIFDEQERDQEPELTRIGDTSWRVDGLLPIDYLADAIGREIPDSPAQTVAGHVAHLLDRQPRAGDTVREGEVVYRVVQIHRNRMRRIQVTVTGVEGKHPGGGPGSGARREARP